MARLALAQSSAIEKSFGAKTTRYRVMRACWPCEVISGWNLAVNVCCSHCTETRWMHSCAPAVVSGQGVDKVGPP